MARLVALAMLVVFSIAVAGPQAGQAAASAGTTNTRAALTNAGATALTNAAGQTILQGKELFEPKESMLMQELGRKSTNTSSARRFEIVFFISIPITLWFSWLLMDAMVRNTRDRNNPNHKLQQPHYIYMFSTSLLTSFCVAVEDARRYPEAEKPKVTDVSEFRFEVPVVGVRF